jgi:hypothetical protein
MTVCIVVEGALEGEIIKQMLRCRGVKNARVFVSQGKSSAQSLTRSLLGVKQLPVALILDADETDPGKVEEQGRRLEVLLNMVAPRKEWELLLMVPEMEAVFFQVPGLLELIGLPSPSPVQQERAQYKPKHVLDELLAQTSKKARPPLLALARRLPREACEKLWTHDAFSRLESFITRFADSPEAGLSAAR